MVRWNHEADVWIDVWAFADLLRDDSRLEEAVALYQGDLLQDLYDDWVLPERDRWREQLLTCLARWLTFTAGAASFLRRSRMPNACWPSNRCARTPSGV